MIALVDYGAGNLTSVRKALTTLGAEFETPREPAECRKAAALIVPGVGNFAATAVLDGPWRDAIAEAVGDGTPLLGICVGMQWLFEGSDEAPGVRGLGVLPGQIQRLDGDAERRLKIPARRLERARASVSRRGCSPVSTPARRSISRTRSRRR